LPPPLQTRLGRLLLERLKIVVTKPAATTEAATTAPAATALWLRPLLVSAELKNCAELGPTTPSTIPAAVASAISVPLLGKTRSFPGLSNILLDPRDREPAPT
jgi:hypothetical protein